ncbi:AAA family ATPase [Streptomyces sp900116325]|uniref:AAA family ATPase n=1 Tax=Streptomyces sp. 900116325 TaxID=3154295 RepID=UPI0033AE33DF
MTTRTAVRGADIIRLAKQARDPFLVPGLVSSYATLWYGQSEVGKSRLVCGFVAAMLRGEPFLGRKSSRPIRRVAILCGEVGGVEEYAKRLCGGDVWEELTEEEAAGLVLVEAPRMRTEEDWLGLRDTLATDAPDLVIVDPVGQMTNGSVNEDETAERFWGGVRALGRPVVAVGHSSVKADATTGQRRGSQTPMGSTQWVSGSRWRVEMLADWTGQLGLLKANGNAGDSVELTLSRGYKLTDFNVKAEQTREEKNAAKAERFEVRTTVAVEAAQWIAKEHPKAGNAEAGRLLAERFPKLATADNPARRIAKDISEGNRGVGKHLVRRDGALAFAL